MQKNSLRGIHTLLPLFNEGITLSLHDIFNIAS
jgi:hypothetical protein